MRDKIIGNPVWLSLSWCVCMWLCGGQDHYTMTARYVRMIISLVTPPAAKPSTWLKSLIHILFAYDTWQTLTRAFGTPTTRIRPRAFSFPVLFPPNAPRLASCKQSQRHTSELISCLHQQSTHHTAYWPALFVGFGVSVIRICTFASACITNG